MVRLNIGTPPQPKLLLLDIAQNYIWIECVKKGDGFLPSKSSTFRPVVRRDGKPIVINISSQARAKLVQDSLTFNSTDGRNPGLYDVEVKRAHFFCAPRSVLPSSSSSYPSLNPPSPSSSSQIAYGVAGLGRGKLSLPSMLASLHKLPRRFAYCLSRSSLIPTPLFLASSNYTFQQGVQVSYLLQYTPLLKQTKKKPGYRVALKAIAVGQETLAINPKVFKGGIEVSTTKPYTQLVTPAYVALRDAFRVAESGIPRVPAVAPFDTCFNASGLGSTRVGAPVQSISFTLADNTTTWTFFGQNSVVFVSDDVMCLAFLDAGPLPSPSVLGTFQQQDSLVEVDLENNRIALTPTLLYIRTNCANFNFTTL